MPHLTHNLNTTTLNPTSRVHAILPLLSSLLSLSEPYRFSGLELHTSQLRTACTLVSGASQLARYFLMQQSSSALLSATPFTATVQHHELTGSNKQNRTQHKFHCWLWVGRGAVHTRSQVAAQYSVAQMLAVKSCLCGELSIAQCTAGCNM